MTDRLIIWLVARKIWVPEWAFQRWIIAKLRQFAAEELPNRGRET